MSLRGDTEKVCYFILLSSLDENVYIPGDKSSCRDYPEISYLINKEQYFRYGMADACPLSPAQFKKWI